MLSVEDSKEFINEKKLHNKDLEINEIKVNLIDNISLLSIKHPDRGLYCDHVPYFSLDYFLLSMENNFTRKWACPICKKRCNKLMVDSYLEMIIDQAKKKNPDLENVFFLKNGDVAFKSDIIDKAEEKRRQEEANAAKAKSNPKKGDKRPLKKMSLMKCLRFFQ
jgi:MIZ/SP-RING zinc finger